MKNINPKDITFDSLSLNSESRIHSLNSISALAFESTLSSKVELAVNSDNASLKDVKLEL